MSKQEAQDAWTKLCALIPCGDDEVDEALSILAEYISTMD